jgi:HAD superfamily hydrolase (TIGR01509 family)
MLGCTWSGLRSHPLATGVAVVGAMVGLSVVANRRDRSEARPRARTGRPFDLANLTTLLIDVDGTLIDSNAAHAEAWAQALTEHGIPRGPAQIRPLIGMGSDKLLPLAAGLDPESAAAEAIVARKQALFAARLRTLQPTPGSRALLAMLRRARKDLVVATSADEQEMAALLEQAGVADLIPERTSSDDASRSKPDPEIVRAALRRAGSRPEATLMIGDTPYDIEAAHRAGVEAIALRSGGYWTDAAFHGALAIFDHPAALLAYWRAPQARVTSARR